MSNHFLVEIHNYITHCIKLSNQEKIEAEDRGDLLLAAFLEGNVTELKSIRKFWTHHFDLITQKYY
jgi:hypothetical protein